MQLFPVFSLLQGIFRGEGFAQDWLLRQSVSSKRPFLRQSEKGPLFPAVLRYYSPEHVRYRTTMSLKSV